MKSKRLEQVDRETMLINIVNHLKRQSLTLMVISSGQSCATSAE